MTTDPDNLHATDEQYGVLAILYIDIRDDATFRITLNRDTAKGWSTHRPMHSLHVYQDAGGGVSSSNITPWRAT